MAVVEKFLVPSKSRKLCFNKDEFKKTTFSVDKFIGECRKSVQLESLLEDLSVYLQFLRSAMIELINKDYADFVNLSSNLVGLDRAIGNLITPVSQLKEEVYSVKAILEDAISAAENLLACNQEIRRKKNLLHQMTSILIGVDKLEKILDGEFSNNSKLMSSNVMERMASEINRLHFAVPVDTGIALIEKQKLRLENITQVVQQNLKESFLNVIEKGDQSSLEQHLRIFALLGKNKDAEELYKKQVVAPFMEKVMSGCPLSLSLNELKSMYVKILDFVSDHCKGLIHVSGSFCFIDNAGYDFIVNSVWNEIAACIDARGTVLYSVNNVSLFHERYVATIHFIDEFESMCGCQASVKRLRNSDSFKTFMKKWNLSVYFQIRFQDIAGNFESCLENNPKGFNSGDQDFKLVTVHTLWQCLQKCWADDVILFPLTHSFWKLNLLLLSRFVTWASQLLQNELRCLQEQSESVISADAGQNSTNKISAETTEKLGFSNTASHDNPSVKLVIFLLADIQKLDTKLSELLEFVIAPIMKQINYNNLSLLNESLDEAKSKMNMLIPLIGTAVTKFITSQCVSHLKMIHDIPRLYRRTNKEVPTKYLVYVTNILVPLQLFLDKYKSQATVYNFDELTLCVVTEVTQQFYHIASDVLTSVKKVEASLKRLKAAREKANSLSASATMSMSDDDKIRLQLFMDVEQFTQLAGQLGCTPSNVSVLESLTSVVESARCTPVREI